ncbi:unnamed protein product [Ascophyllum nodosum]
MDDPNKFTVNAGGTTEYGESEDGGGAHVKLQPCPTACKVRVILHRRCRWPEDSTLSERQSWGVELLVDAKRHWSVRQLATEAEMLLREKHGVTLATALVLCLSRDAAIPFYGQLFDYAEPKERLELVGDVERVRRSALGPASKRETGLETGRSDSHGRASRPSGADPSPPQKVPVTILTGFLGAGKTSLLNHLLHTQREKRIAVIENEFGAVPIDAELLADGDGLSAAEQVVVLDNGCMCCSVRGDLLGAFASVSSKLEEAKARGDRGNKVLDSVLVETTGMADPVPIVRTLLQTPAIANYFALDGVVTLVDAKNLLERLRAGENADDEDGATTEGEVDEAFQQIMFSDRIVINKVDLVSASTAVEVFERVRSINSSAGVVSCTKGKLDPAELEGLGAFDRLMREAEEEPVIEEEEDHHDHDHDHSHSHSTTHSAVRGGEGARGPWVPGVGEAGEGIVELEEACTLEHDHGEHSHGHRHNTQVGTFSLVKKSTEVLALPFARWVRKLAVLPKEKGTLFRSKAVLAVAGSDRKLVFHAVSDVMERKEAGRWTTGEERSCRIVFIGKRLDRAFLEEGFNATCRAVVGKALPSQQGDGLVCPPSLDAASLNPPDESFLEAIAVRVPSAFYLAMSGLGTGEILRVASACSGLWRAVEGDQAVEHYRALAEGGLTKSPGFHLSARRSSPSFYVHHLVSAATARSYAKAAAGAKLEIIPSMGLGRTGISFATPDELEAAGITWLEIEELADPAVKNFVVEFSWRPETMASFFESPNSSTSSAIVKVEYEVEDEDAYDEEVDTLKFRLVLRPETEANNQISSASPPQSAPGASLGVAGGQPDGAGAGTDPAIPMHRLMIQTVGGRSCSQVYGLSFHSLSLSFQVHVPVPDHRVPYFLTDQLFHKWHPLMEQLRTQPRLRFLVRIKPDGSGPLDNMCGCC